MGEEIVDAIGIWEKLYKGFELYFVLNNIDVGTVIISPSEYQCGEVLSMDGISVDSEFNIPQGNQSVGKVRFAWESVNPV